MNIKTSKYEHEMDFFVKVRARHTFHFNRIQIARK